MGILTGSAIKEAVARGDIMITPYKEENVGPNSYDVTLSENLVRYANSHLYCDQENTILPVLPTHRANGKYGWYLEPGVVYLGSTQEWASSDKYVQNIDGRSSLGRLGIRIHATAGRGDVGFGGKWTLEIDVIQPVWLEAGIRVGQLTFFTVEGEIKDLYRGKYGGHSKPVASRLHTDTRKG